MRMNGSCAGVTGAFIDEIASVLKVPVEEFNSLAAEGKCVYDISGRCGVYAKTDIQPLLNQGISKADLALSAFHAIAKQTIGGLSQGLEIKPPVAFEGGPLTFNPVLVKVFAGRLNLSEQDILVPPHSELMIAYGADLPEAQVDRFMVCLSLGYPDYESELAMAKGIGPDEKYRMIQPVLTGGMLQDMQKEIYQVYMKDSVYEYLLNLVRATRDHSAVARGASPRATIALVKMAKAAAWMEGRDYVTPLDVSGQFPYVVSHRILLSGTAKMEKKTKKQIIDEIIKNTKIPPMGEGYR